MAPLPYDSAPVEESAHSRCILYLDADRFYYSVELLERPELREETRPVVIAHHPREYPRAVVTTANDAARALGIGSAMSAAIALRRAPNALFLPPRHGLYAVHSDRLMRYLRQESPLVQQNSIDEAACAWDERGFDAIAAIDLRARIRDELQLSVSLGVATSPLVAKMASESAKGTATGVHVVLPGEEQVFLAPLPIRALVGIGPRSETRLKSAGIATIGEIAARDLADLVTLCGQSYGRYLHAAARGIDEGSLTDERVARSISAERTFATDTADRALLWQALRDQCDEVAVRVRDSGMVAAEIAVKLRYGNWQTLTRQMRLTAASDDAAVFAGAAGALMRRHWERGRALRLLGVRAGKLAARTVVQGALPLSEPA